MVMRMNKDVIRINERIRQIRFEEMPKYRPCDPKKNELYSELEKLYKEREQYE
jgi:hypothetical protein